jgi:hypothetical protein
MIRILGKKELLMNQPTTINRHVNTRSADIHVGTELPALAKAIAAFAFSDLTVRHCGRGLPPVLPWRQGDWTIDKISKSDLRQDSIIDMTILSKLSILDQRQIPYDHIYVGHQDKKPFEVPEKVVNVVKRAIPVLAGATVAILTVLGAVVAFTAQAAVVVVADPVVVVAIKEKDGSYQLLEIAKWYS